MMETNFTPATSGLDIDIPVGDVVLAGILTLPPRARGVVVSPMAARSSASRS
jgi:hypothetical protein